MNKKRSASIGLTKVAEREKRAHHPVCRTPAWTRSDLAGALGPFKLQGGRAVKRTREEQ